MSKLEELINSLCPDGVTFKYLWEITIWDKRFIGSKKSMQPSVKKFKHISAKELKSLTVANGDIKLLSTGNFDAYTSDNLAQEYINDDEIIAIPSGGSPIVKYYYGKFIDSGNILAVSSNNKKYNLKYIYYYMMNNLDFLETCYRGPGIKHPDMSKILNFTIPVPPIEVQREIVKILDNFTDLTAELTAELTARKKQYEYYRDYLLNFDGQDIKYKKFGEVCVICRGASPRPIANFITNDLNGVNWIKIGDTLEGNKYINDTKEKITIAGAKQSRLVKKGDFVLSNSMSFGRPYILNIDGCIHDGWLAISDYENYFISDFLFHLLSSSLMQKTMKQKASFGGAVQNLNSNIVRNLWVPIPSLEKQYEIVKILDKFNTMCSDITSGLPAEIVARQKQYEYYRDKLLTFKKLEV